MNLIVRIKQKNDQLLSQQDDLKKQFLARVNTPELNSFLIAFVAAPFFIGAIARFFVVTKRSIPNQLCRAVFPGFGLWRWF